MECHSERVENIVENEEKDDNQQFFLLFPTVFSNTYIWNFQTVPGKE